MEAQADDFVTEQGSVSPGFSFAG